jgi:hypothetical protein
MVLLLGLKAAVLVRVEKSCVLLALKPVHAGPEQPLGVSWMEPPLGGFAGALTLTDFTLSSGR